MLPWHQLNTAIACLFMHLDFEARYIEDRDQTECVWGFFLQNLNVHHPLLDGGSSYFMEHKIDILCRKMFTGNSFETYIQDTCSKFLFHINNNVVHTAYKLQGLIIIASERNAIDQKKKNKKEEEKIENWAETCTCTCMQV